MRSWEKLAIATLLFGGTCLGCAGRAMHFDGMPGNAAAMTYCDNDGNVRTVMDAQLLEVDSLGRLRTHFALGEILIHEAVHRGQLNARRPKASVCPPELTMLELVGVELEAYCAQYQWAMAHGAQSFEVGSRIFRSLRDRFGPVWGKDFQMYFAPRWAQACPGYALAWDSP